MANFPHSSPPQSSLYLVSSLHTAKNLNKTMQRQKKKKIPTLHLLMVGDSHVGKSCLMNRHCFGSFNHNHVTVSIQSFLLFVPVPFVICILSFSHTYFLFSRSVLFCFLLQHAHAIQHHFSLSLSDNRY